MPNKSALLIGIDKYPYLADFAQLKGCKNDVAALKEILEQKFEFPTENIRTLLDEESTREAILDAMKSVVENCGAGDTIVFSFSGHGSRIRTRRKAKASGWYETIMPFDSGRKKYHPQGKNLDITDDEIYTWLMDLSEKTSNIILIIDSCYAGSITRDDVFGAGIRGIPPDNTVIRESFARVSTEQNRGASGWLPKSNKYVLIAACAEHERAHIFKKQNGDEIIEYGILTYFLCEALREAKSGSTYRDIWDQVYLNVRTRFDKQNPQLEGNRDRELFGFKEFPSIRFLPVSKREGSYLTLSGGRLQGVTPNSQWAIYPPGTKSFSLNEEFLGQVKVVSVWTSASKALLLDENEADVIQPGSRAVEIFRPHRKSRIKLWIEDFPPEFAKRFAKLQRLLNKSPLLKVVAKKEQADARIHLSIICEETSDHISKPVLTVYGQDDCILTPPQTNLEMVVKNLELLCRYRQVVELRNPSSSLLGKIEFNILKQNPDGTWSEVKPTGDEQKTVINESDRIALRIINRFKSPVFFSILDLGLSKKISLLYPPPGATVMIGPMAEDQSHGAEKWSSEKGVFMLGIADDESIELSFPDNFPFTSSVPGNGIVPDEGLEIFKLIVTTRPHDLNFLEQENIRTEINFNHPTENLIFDALRGDKEFNKEPLSRRLNEWLAIEKFFFLKRS